MTRLYPPIVNDVVELRLGKILRTMRAITNDEMDRLRTEIREEVLQEQRFWDERNKKPKKVN